MLLHAYTRKDAYTRKKQKFTKKIVDNIEVFSNQFLF